MVSARPASGLSPELWRNVTNGLRARAELCADTLENGAATTHATSPSDGARKREHDTGSTPEKVDAPGGCMATASGAAAPQVVASVVLRQLEASSRDGPRVPFVGQSLSRPEHSCARQSAAPTAA